MAIEKFSRTNIEGIPFTQVCNKVINEITDMEAFTVWVYLLSKSEDWEVIKSHVKARFNVGNDKLKRIFKYLNDHNLIEYRRERLANGTLGEIQIWILNGSKWVGSNAQPVCANAQVICANAQENPSKINTSTTGVKIQPVVNHTCGSGKLLNKDNTKERKSTKKTSCPSKLARDIHFEEMWSAYPRKENKKRAREIWIRDNLDDKAQLIIADIVMRRLKHAQWKQVCYIPMPCTYLNGEQWNDAITEEQKQVKPTAKNEPKQTAQFWGEGNPDYDRVHGVKRESQSQPRDRDGREGMRTAKDCLFS